MIINSILNDGNFSYFEGIDCEVHWNSAICECFDICRCATIDSINLTDFNFVKLSENMSQYIIEHFCQEKKIDLNILKYLIQRLFVIHEGYDVEKYEVQYEGGYYGDETRGVHFSNLVNFNHDLLILCNLHSIENMVKFILKKEYGSVLPKLETLQWTSDSKNLCDIKVTGQEKYLQEVKEQGVSYEVSLSSPIVVIQEDILSNTYRIIDGYHRYASILKQESEGVNLLVGRPSEYSMGIESKPWKKFFKKTYKNKKVKI